MKSDNERKLKVIYFPPSDPVSRYLGPTRIRRNIKKIRKHFHEKYKHNLSV